MDEFTESRTATTPPADADTPSGAWVPFYEELADKLLPFRADRATLVDHVRAVYEKTGAKFPTLQAKGAELSDIDPFTVFGLFNKGITDENRRKIAGTLKELLGVRADLPDEFGGIPVLNNLNATFYTFVNDPKGRPDEIEDLWGVFAAALAYADDPGDTTRNGFIVAFDRARDIKGNRRKLCMGLYWIRPLAYLNLDNCNTSYIKEHSGLPATIAQEIGTFHELPEGEVYLGWCDAVRVELESGAYPYHDLVGLSTTAWYTSKEENERKRAENEATEATATRNAESRPVQYWLYSPGKQGSIWDECRRDGIMAIGWDELGDLGQFESQEEVPRALQKLHNTDSIFMNDAKCLWEFSHVMEPGDVVVAKRGARTIIGRGVVRGGYRFEPEREHFIHVRDVEWTHAWEWDLGHDIASKTLTNITNRPAYMDYLPGFFTDEYRIPQSDAEPADAQTLGHTPSLPPYTREDFLRDVYLEAPALDTLEHLVRHKKNVVLEGAPGTGKTFCARRLAWELMGKRDDGCIVALQFHQSYSYEDFVEGYRPTATGFELRHGAFYELCHRAEADPDRSYFMLIDEINRANLSKVLGELFGLLEADKRGEKTCLLYSNEAFSVPENLYVIGTMNTADRSLALIDYALRRRFAFFAMEPAFESRQFRAYADALGSPALDALTEAVRQLNAAVAADDALGPGFAIGHSYLCNLMPGEATAENLRRVVDFELAPLVREYWFDEPGKAEEQVEHLRAALS